jgi:hypothetical protein
VIQFKATLYNDKCGKRYSNNGEYTDLTGYSETSTLPQPQIEEAKQRDKLTDLAHPFLRVVMSDKKSIEPF